MVPLVHVRWIIGKRRWVHCPQELFPKFFYVLVEQPGIFWGATFEDCGFNMTSILWHTGSNTLKYVAVLMHLASPMCGLITFVWPNLQLNNGMDAHIGDNMRSIAHQPGQAFVF